MGEEVPGARRGKEEEGDSSSCALRNDHRRDVSHPDRDTERENEIPVCRRRGGRGGGGKGGRAAIANHEE